MADEGRKDAQEVQEAYTLEEIRAALDKSEVSRERIRAALDKTIPKEHQQKLIHSAAVKYGMNAEELTIEDAAVLLTAENPNPEIAAAIKNISERATTRFMESATNEQLKEMAGHLLNGRLIPGVMDALEGTQEVQEVIPDKKAEKLAELIDQQLKIKDLRQALENAIKEILDSDFYKEMRAGIALIKEFALTHKAELEAFKNTSDALQDLGPYILMELKKPEYKELTTVDIWANISPDGEPITPIGETILLNAYRHRDSVRQATEITEALPVIAAAAVTELDYPLDKVNNKLWNQFKNADPDGQLFWDSTFITSPRGREEAGVYLSINFGELDKLPGLQITRGLTAFDKRLYMAAAAAGAAGNGYTSLGRLHEAMGNTGKPSSGQLERIEQSLQKMGKAWITIQNPDEIAAKMKYPQFEYNGPLLPFEQVRALVNGQVTESAVHFFREPPLVTFARERKQITTVSRRLLESPISKTEDNLRIDDYLIDRIAQMKNNKKNPRKILLETLYTECAIKGKQKQRAPEKIKKYLDHYQKEKFIQGYSMDNEKITFVL